MSTFVSFNSKASRAAAVSSGSQRKALRGITKSPLRSQLKTSAAQNLWWVGRGRASLLGKLSESLYTPNSAGLKAVEKPVRNELFLSPILQVLSLWPYAV